MKQREIVEKAIAEKLPLILRNDRKRKRYVIPEKFPDCCEAHMDNYFITDTGLRCYFDDSGRDSTTWDISCPKVTKIYEKTLTW